MGTLIVCTHCGTEKMARYMTTKFCSNSCRGKYNKKNRGHEQECKQCGGTFSRYKRQDFCSTDCRSNHLKSIERINDKPVYIPRSKKEKECINCEKKYLTKSSTSKYCSYECSYEYKVIQKTIHNIKCLECSWHFSSTNRIKVYC